MNYQEIIDRIPLRKTFGQYTKLIADGSFWKGDCPLCHAKENNFVLNTEKKLFYCYACQEDGTPIDFIAKVESYSVKEAVQQLITMWGIHESVIKDTTKGKNSA